MIRLYDKYQLSFANSRDEFTEKMKSQYEFAKDQIPSLGVGLTGLDDSESAKSKGLGMVLISKHYQLTPIHCRQPVGLCLPNADLSHLRSGSHDVIQEFR